MTDHQSGQRRTVGPGESDGDRRSDAKGSWAWFVVAFVSYVLFIALSVAIWQGVALGFDRSWLDTAHGWTQFPSLWRLLSDSANYPLIVIGVGIVLWLLIHGERREAILVIVVLAAATAGSEAVKELVARPRPLGPDPNIPGAVYSFPSGHVLEAATIYGIIGIRAWRGSWPRWAKMAIAIVFSLFVLAVGVARVAMAEHYPTDVIAGLLAGIGDLAVFGGLSWSPRRQPETKAAARRQTEEPAG